MKKWPMAKAASKDGSTIIQEKLSDVYELPSLPLTSMIKFEGDLDT